MKKIIAIIFLFVSINVFAQRKDSILAEITKLQFTPTEIGKPDGEPVAQKIGANGGRLISSDNKVELNIPAGALLSETMISIQPSTNPAESSVGKSYSFEPSGIQFLQPVQVVFHYTDKEIDRNSPQLMTISSQDKKGVWFRLRKVTLDTIAKTITGNIKHFSWWAMTWAFHFAPSKSRVKVGKEVIIWAYPFPTDEDYSDSSDVIRDIYGVDKANPRIWTVNGVPNGDGINGTIEDVAGAAIYKAPATVPANNPVVVMLEIKGATMGEVGSYKNNTLTKKCQIRVYDNEYEVKMEAQLVGGSPAEWGGVVTYSDKGSFIVSLDNNKPVVVNIQNHLEKVKYSTCPDRVITNPRTCTGIFHVAGARQIKVTPANPPGQLYSIVEIWFVPYPTELTRFTFNCPPPPGARERSKGKVDLTTGSPPPMLMFFGMPALPPYIKFIAKDEEQVILESPRGVREIYYKVWVKKVNVD
jgi:hypothetical protein